MEIIKKFQILCFLNKNETILYQKNKLYKYNINLKKKEHIQIIENNLRAKIKNLSRLIGRLFRDDVRTSYLLNSRELIFFKNKILYYIDLKKNKIKIIKKARPSFSTPLNICESITNKYLVFYGDYGSNKDYKSVNIYGLDKNLEEKIVFSFSNKSIRHIHNIIVDRVNQGYIIFTGDNEKKSGIYWIDKNFYKLKPILLGRQEYRAVSGFLTPKGLLYATDSVEKENFIFLLSDIMASPKLIKLKKINGSCIYSGETCDKYYFSTTVESSEKLNKWIKLFSTKRGKGILSDYVEIIEVDKNYQVKVKYKMKKDRWPYNLFQYGFFTFPMNMKIQNRLIVNSVGMKKIDGDILLF